MTDVTLRIKVDSSEVDRGSKSLDGLAESGKNTEKSLDKTQTSAVALGKQIAALAVAYGAVGAATSAIRTTANFQQAIADLSAITGATGKDLEYYSQQAALIGRTTSLSASEAATAFKLIASAKPDLLTSAQSLAAVTKEAVALAEATGESLPAAASALGSALNQFQLPASDASRVINVLAASAQLGTAEVGSVTEAMRNAGSAANSLGLDFEETVAGIQALAASGREGADAGTALRQVLLRLESTADQTLQPSIVGLDKSLQELASRSLNNTELMDLFGQEAFTAATSLIAQKDVVTDLNVTLRGTSTAYEQAATRMDTFSGDLLGLKSAMEGLQIEAMNNSINGLGRSLVQVSTSGVNFLTENLNTLKTVAEVMAILVGAKLTSAFAVSFAGSLTTAMAAMSAKTVTTTTYNAALMVMQANVVKTTVAQNAMVIATTAANAALTLIGGPIGALLITGAAMYMMWNRNTEAVGFFTSTIGVAEKELNNLRNSGGSLQAQIDVVTAAIKETTMQLDVASSMFGENSRDSEALKDELRRLESQLFNLNRTQDEYNIKVAKGTEGTSLFVGPIKQATTAMTQLDAATAAVTRRTDEEIEALRRSAVELDHGTRSTGALTTASNELINSLSVVRMSYSDFIPVLAKTEWQMMGVQKAVTSNQEAVDAWTKVSTRGSEQRAAAEIESQRKQEEAIARTHEYLTTSFIDIFNNGKNAFDNIAKAFSAMIQRMLAEWAASKLMNLIGMGSGTATANPFAAIGSAISSAIGGSAASAAGTAAAGTAGGAAAGTGIGATLASAAGSVGTAITGGAAAVGSAISGGASAATAMIVANPLLAAAAVAAAAAAALAKKPTTSSNAGLLIHDAPGASADRKFAVEEFASGFSPVGFARCEDQSAANEVIDVFRKYDSSLTEIAKAAGLNVNFSNNPFGGFDEKGQGNGLFLGTAAEEKKGVTSAPISEQLTQFTKQWVEALGGQVSSADREYLLSSSSADQLLERAATLGQAEQGRLSGSLFGGIRTVPFNGFRAELHKGEEVLTASDPRNSNNGGMMTEMRDMLVEMRNMAFYTKRTADLLLRVTRDGDSLVTVAA